MECSSAAKGALFGLAALTAFIQLVAAMGQLPILNTPPVMYVDRNWRISEAEPVGSIIARVKAEDEENDLLQFDLEPQDHNYGIRSNNESTNFVLPFRIDSKTGIVYLNESLLGRGGENFFLYITVSDGQLTAKNEVYVNIYSRNSEPGFGSKTTAIKPPTHNISQFFPPFYSLPGVSSNTRTLPFNISPVATPPIRPNQSIVNGYVKDNSAVTKLTSVRTNYNTNSNKTSSDNELSTLDDGSHVESLAEMFLVKAIIPIIIAICAIFIAVVFVVLYICRRHDCNFTKKFKNESKQEIDKKSRQGNNFSSSMDDHCSSSIALHQRNGSLSQRYSDITWSNNQSMPSSQLSKSGLNDDMDSTTDRWEYPRHRLKFFNLLGEGAFGQVWRCEATNIDGNDSVTTVAVKTLRENASEIERNDLFMELQVMKTLQPHVNVVRLLGCCTHKEPILVIIEYVNCGKLQTYLRNSRAERHYGNTHEKSTVLTSTDLTSFMYQVSRGMEYLSSRGIIHRDLAARNILIKDDHTCKIADFGFARDIVTTKVYERKSEGKLPIRWMAIESLYDNIFSVKSDIWSFGILMWEIVTLGSTPYPGISAADVMRKVRDGYRLEKPEHCRRELYNIMYYCWSKDPNERPSFLELVQLLDSLLRTEMDYIELERFPDHNYYNMLNISGEKL